MTTDDARAALAVGALTLRQLANAWRCPVAEVYVRIYDRPMLPPARPAGPERRTINYEYRRTR